MEEGRKLTTSSISDPRVVTKTTPHALLEIPGTVKPVDNLPELFPGIWILYGEWNNCMTSTKGDRRRKSASVGSRERARAEANGAEEAYSDKIFELYLQTTQI